MALIDRLCGFDWLCRRPSIDFSRRSSWRFGFVNGLEYLYLIVELPRFEIRIDWPMGD